MSSSVPQTQNLLDRCVTALHWAGMGFRPSKSRSIVIANGKVLDESPFCVLQKPIPSIHANPVKFLGRTINSTLSDLAVVQQVIVNAVEQVKLIDKSSHRGIHKVLYSASSPCPLPLKSLSSVLKSAKISGYLLLRDSADPLVSGSPPDFKAGHWKVDQTVKSAESQLEFKKILGFHQFDVVQDNEEDIYYARAVQLHVKGNWTNGACLLNTIFLGRTYCLCRKVYLRFASSQPMTHFLLLQILSSGGCTLCKKPSCNVSHILGACKLYLPQGRFMYRHDTVLRVLVTAIQNFLYDYEPAKPSRCHKISFVPAGKRLPTKRRSKIQGILHLASDWRLLSHLDSTLTLSLPAIFPLYSQSIFFGIQPY
ncbi:uncharacterized protein LOC130648007 [Hydractinia symbiolongicarpus]|uniref:uncharacterized protein LOC130648007 n=1 Tax=Hydractinia symbiolongicarpus TaxID=13093 RepID=UPI00254C7D76|nr:uncharacterized protein LOC130648007 [Hydractinia symbiolongicarpus]